MTHDSPQPAPTTPSAAMRQAEDMRELIVGRHDDDGRVIVIERYNSGAYRRPRRLLLTVSDARILVKALAATIRHGGTEE